MFSAICKIAGFVSESMDEVLNACLVSVLAKLLKQEHFL